MKTKGKENYRVESPVLSIDVDSTAEVMREVGKVRLAWTTEDGEFDGADSLANFLIALAHLAAQLDATDAWPGDDTRAFYFRSMATMSHALRELVAGKVLSTESAVKVLSVDCEEDVYMLSGALGLSPVTREQVESVIKAMPPIGDVVIH